MTIVNTIMSIAEPEYCDMGSSISCPVVRPPPRYCVDLLSNPGSCSCQTRPPIFPIEVFPPPPTCPGWCIFLMICIVMISVLILLCILACWIGQDDKPRRTDKPSISQRLLYYWYQMLFFIRCALKKMFGNTCPSQCYLLVIRAVTPIGRCCRPSDPENTGSDNTERTSEQTNTPTHHPSVPSSVCLDDVHLDAISADKGLTSTRRMNGISMDVKIPQNNHSKPTDLTETKIETQPKSKEPVQTETSIVSASPKTRTRKVAPSETNGDHNPTPV